MPMKKKVKKKAKMRSAMVRKNPLDADLGSYEKANIKTGSEIIGAKKVKSKVKMKKKSAPKKSKVSSKKKSAPKKKAASKKAKAVDAAPYGEKVDALRQKESLLQNVNVPKFDSFFGIGIMPARKKAKGKKKAK